MSMFNRRNALIGYLVLRAMKRARRNVTIGYLAAQGIERTRAHRRGRRALRLGLYAVLGVVSLGVLAALAGFWRRQSSSTAASVGEAAEAGEAVALEGGPGGTEAGAAVEGASEALESAPAT